MAKVSEKAKIEAGNLMEEASEVFDSCVGCGMCKSRCGVFRVLRSEEFSARGRGELISEKVMDKILFECNLCRGCEEACPLNVKVCDAVLKCRQAMVLLGKGLSGNEEMVKMVMKNGVPFDKSGKGKEKLVCC